MGFDIYVRWDGFEGFDDNPLAYTRQHAVSHNPPAGLLSYSADMPAHIRNRAQQLNIRNPLALLLERLETVLVVSDGSEPTYEIRDSSDGRIVQAGAIEPEFPLLPLVEVRAERDRILDDLAKLNRELAFDSRFIMEAMIDAVAFLNYVLLLVLEGKQNVTIHISL